MKHLSLVVLAAMLPLAAQAAEPIGKLQAVSGIVSLSGATLASQAKAGVPLLAGHTVTVSTYGKATVVLEDGCVLRLLGGQQLTLNQQLTCSQLYASVRQLAAPYQIAQAGGGGVAAGGGAGAGVGAGLVAAGIVGTGVTLLKANAPDASGR